MTQSFLFIVPTLNCVATLPKLISSLDHQSEDNWSALFVDGGSIDGTLELIRKVCSHSKNYKYVNQSSDNHSIFGAMNQGASLLYCYDWYVFLGGDDWLPDSQTLYRLAATLDASNSTSYPIAVARGQYIDQEGQASRKSRFLPLWPVVNISFRNALFLGFTPPHQCTLFRPATLERLGYFDNSYRLAADLDFFLRLSFVSQLHYLPLEVDLVNIREGGVSGQQNLRRFKEVIIAYFRAYGLLFFIPFTLRYLNRFLASCF